MPLGFLRSKGGCDGTHVEPHLGRHRLGVDLFLGSRPGRDILNICLDVLHGHDSRPIIPMRMSH